MVAEDSNTKNLVCFADDCFRNCHVNCNCWFTFFSVRFCSSFKGGKCTKCSHSTSSHSLLKIQYKKVFMDILLPDEDRLARRKCLDQELLEYDEDISSETKKLESKIAKFQSVGSNFIFSKISIDHIDKLV